MRIFRLPLLALSLFVLFATAAPASAQSSPAESAANVADLTPDFYEGMTSRYEMWSTRTTLRSTSVNDRSQEANTRLEITGELTWRIDSVSPDGSATATMTYDWLSANFEMPDGTVTVIDTRQGAPQEPFTGMHQLMQAMTRVPITYKMAADGSVLSVDGVNQIKASVPENVQTPEEADFLESASDLATLVEAPMQLEVGNNWQVSRTWKRNIAQMDADLQLDTTYDFTSLEEIAGIPVATITARSKARLDPVIPELPPEVPRPRVTSNATSEQQIMFDLARHEAVGRNAYETLTVDIQMSARGMTVSTHVEEIMQSQVLRIAEPQ